MAEVEPSGSTTGSDAIRLAGAIGLADRATDFVERPIRRLSGPARLNPLPHAGTISERMTGRQGREVFTSRAAGCTVCHSVLEGDDGVGPSLHGVASVAAERIPGVDAEFYLRQSVLLPYQYVVDGWPAGQMLPIYRERLTEQELDALIAYLLTLSAEDDA